MQPQRKLSLALALALAAQLVLARPAAACSCVDPGPPAAAFSYMPVVFRGVVTAVNATPIRSWSPLVDWLRQRLGLAAPPAGTMVVQFNVTHSWKGHTATTAAVVQSGICGAYFDLQRDYVVYAWADTYGLTTSMCTRTAEVSLAAADLAYLQTLPTLPLRAAPPGPAVSGLAALAAGGLAVVGLAVGVVRRSLRKQKGIT